jgi:hypothetical protein
MSTAIDALTEQEKPDLCSQLIWSSWRTSRW